VLSRQRRSANADAGVPENDGIASAPDRKAQKRAEALARQRSYGQRKPLADRQAQIERELDALNSERQALEDWLASADAYTGANKDALKEKLARQGDATWQLARLEAEWLEVSEALERIGIY
jgi:ATP-binding cassette subfamily F protein 3